jgi:lysophospholipase L1-like esterase
MRKLADEAGCLFNVSAQVSTTTLDWAGNRLDLLLSSQRPAVALVSLGTNDATMSDPERARSRIQAIVESAKKYGVRLYWIGPPTLPARIQGADAIRAMIRETGVPYFESDKIEFERSADGVHATMLGYRGWADAVWEWMLGREQAQ